MSSLPPRPRLRTLLTAVAPLLASVAACGGDRPTDGAPSDVGGMLVMTVAGAPGTLLPPHVTTLPSKQLTDLIFQRLADIGPELNTLGDAGFRPGLARAWSWSDDSLAITFRLHEGARWHDGAPVTSEDVRFTVALGRDPAAESMDLQHLQHVDSVTTPDSLTAVVWYARRTPEQFYDVAGRVAILPAHLLRDVAPAELRFHALATTPVGSGRWRFVRMEPGVLVELAADTTHVLGRPRLDRFVMSVAPDPVSGAARFLQGETDVYEALSAEVLRDVEGRDDLTARVFPGTSYSFLAFNLRAPGTTRPHPILADRETRRALSMLVDRPQLARDLLGDLGAVGTGPFPRSLPVADTTLRQLPHDPQRAAALLDSLGWRLGPDGVRRRGGRPLELSVLLPSSSAIRVRFATGLQQQLAAAGVRLTLRPLEFGAFQEQGRTGRFDAVLNSWTLADGSPNGMRNTWGTNGNQNWGGYGNPAVDALIDSGRTTFDPAARRQLFGRAFQAMIDDAPAMWLYEPHNTLGISARFRTPELRPVGWWLDLHEWWIPAGERTDRDRVAGRAIAGR